MVPQVKRLGGTSPDTPKRTEAMPECTVAAIQALSPEEKNVISNSPARTMQLDPQSEDFPGHALAGVKEIANFMLSLRATLAC